MVTSGAGEAVPVHKGDDPLKNSGEDASATPGEAPQTRETRWLTGSLSDAVSGCLSSGFTTQPEVSELALTESRPAIPASCSRSVPVKSGVTLFLGSEAGMAPPSPTKSLERRPATLNDFGFDPLCSSGERIRGGKDGHVAHDARTGCATNLKQLAENLVNEAAGASPSGASSPDVPEAPPQPVDIPMNAVSMTHIPSEASLEVPIEIPPSEASLEVPIDIPEVGSTGAFTVPQMDSALSEESNPPGNQQPPEATVVQPAAQPANQTTVQVMMVEALVVPGRREQLSGTGHRDEAPMGGSTLPLDTAPRNSPAQGRHHPGAHALPTIAAPLFSRWCCAKISMISMAIMSLFAAFMVYAFREDTFVDLVNWAATWNASSIRAKLLATQAMSEAGTLIENVTYPDNWKRNVP